MQAPDPSHEPVVEAPNPAARAQSSPAGGVSSIRAAALDAPSAQPKVLLVDDRQANLVAMDAVLAPLGLRVVLASTADEALRAVLANDFAVILLDVEMPGTDGYEIARLIKRRESSRLTPIIFVTALSNDRRLVTSGYESGAVDYLFKPLDAELLRAKVSAFVELYVKREEEAWRQRRRYADLMEDAARESEIRLRVAYESEHRAREEAERAREAAEYAQANAEAAQAAAEDASRAKSNFLAIMSHELRTPLNAFQGYVQLLEMGLAGEVTEQQREYLSRLDGSARHLLVLIEDVLDMAKVDAGQLSVSRERGFAAEVVAAAMALTAPQASARGVRVVDRGPCDGTVTYMGDESRMRQILVNLIGNGIKFTNPGGEVSIDCGVQPAAPVHVAGGQGPWTFVRVSDNGIGIASGDLGRIFEAFHQVDSGHTRTRGGTGLGLSISRRLARLMSGDITVESTPGSGSTFTLWLPAADPADDPAVTVQRSARTASAAGVGDLGEIGELLSRRREAIVAEYREKLRLDPRTPLAPSMRSSHVEDHAVSLVSDIGQSLLIIAESGPDAAEMIRDGSAIQRTVAEYHGRRRCAQGWSRDAVDRDLEILRDAIEHAVRGAARAPSADARGVLLTMIERARAISLSAWDDARRRGAQ